MALLLYPRSGLCLVGIIAGWGSLPIRIVSLTDIDFETDRVKLLNDSYWCECSSELKLYKVREPWLPAHHIQRLVAETGAEMMISIILLMWLDSSQVGIKINYMERLWQFSGWRQPFCCCLVRIFTEPLLDLGTWTGMETSNSDCGSSPSQWEFPVHFKEDPESGQSIPRF